MQVGGVNVSPESANHMLVSLNGVIQKPTDAYTVSGSTITFASNLITGDVIDFIQILGNVLDLGVPSDNTVSLAKLTATGTKDATTFLRGDNTFQTVSSYTDSDALTLFNASGSAPVYACRAWVNFNGTGTVAIRASGNVSSITDNGVGEYTMNFTTAMQDVNYTLVGACADAGKNRTRVFSGVSSTNTTISTSAVAITIDRHDSTSRDDMSYVYASVFR